MAKKNTDWMQYGVAGLVIALLIFFFSSSKKETTTADTTTDNTGGGTTGNAGGGTGSTGGTGTTNTGNTGNTGGSGGTGSGGVTTDIDVIDDTEYGNPPEENQPPATGIGDATNNNTPIGGVGSTTYDAGITPVAVVNYPSDFKAEELRIKV